jgi:hypothetical protein
VIKRKVNYSLLNHLIKNKLKSMGWVDEEDNKCTF